MSKRKIYYCDRNPRPRRFIYIGTFMRYSHSYKYYDCMSVEEAYDWLGSMSIRKKNTIISTQNQYAVGTIIFKFTIIIRDT